MRSGLILCLLGYSEDSSCCCSAPPRASRTWASRSWWASGMRWRGCTGESCSVKRTRLPRVDSFHPSYSSPAGIWPTFTPGFTFTQPSRPAAAVRASFLPSCTFPDTGVDIRDGHSAYWKAFPNVSTSLTNVQLNWTKYVPPPPWGGVSFCTAVKQPRQNDVL